MKAKVWISLMVLCGLLLALAAASGTWRGAGGGTASLKPPGEREDPRVSFLEGQLSSMPGSEPLFALDGQEAASPADAVGILREPARRGGNCEGCRP